MPSDADHHEYVLDRLTVESITLGVSLRDCSSRLLSTARALVYDRVRRVAAHLPDSTEILVAQLGCQVEGTYVSVTPISIPFDGFSASDYVGLAETLDRAADDVGIRGIGGFTALCGSAISSGDEALVQAIPGALGSTQRVFAAVACASSTSGVNARAVELLSESLSGGMKASYHDQGIPRIAVLGNATGTSPVFPGAFQGIEQPELTLGVAVSLVDPLTVLAGLSLPQAIRTLREIVARLSRGGSIVARHCAELLGERSGLSVAPGRVEVVSALSSASSETGLAPQTRDILEHPGFRAARLPGQAPPLHRLVRHVEPGTTARELTHLLLPPLADAVAGGWELNLPLSIGAG